MARIKFSQKIQGDFLAKVKMISGLTWPQFANKIGVHPRTLFDWRREKFTITHSALKQCLRITSGKITTPSYELLPDFWSIPKAARMGGISTAKKYGGPGTPEGRRKGGLMSQKKRKDHPEFYQHCGLRKKISKPHDSVELAELLGIILGDGGINNDYQVVVTLNKDNDKDYAIFIRDLIKKLFSLTPIFYRYRSPRCRKVIGVTISSVAVVDFLLSKGLKKGSKVRQQTGAPDWIKNNLQFSSACLRGLMDTDGGVYFHRHQSNQCQCFNIGLCLTNKSIPILRFAQETLSRLNFHPKMTFKSINLYRAEEVNRYIEEVSFHNRYHLERWKKFLKEKEIFRRVAPNGKAHAWKA